MNILPKKRWHVRTKDNIARVRRDEAVAKEFDQKRQEKLLTAESEARINFLRKKCSATSSSSIHHDKGLPAVHETQKRNQQHVDLFSDYEIHIKKTNKALEQEKKEVQEKFEKQIGYLTYLGQDTNEALKLQSWYEKAPKREEVEDLLIPERDLKNKHSQDPLTLINALLPAVDCKTVNPGSSRRAHDEETLAFCASPPLIKINKVDKVDRSMSANYKNHKKNKKEKCEKKQKKFPRYDSDTKEVQRLKQEKLEKLRKERLVREASERLRQDALFAPMISKQELHNAKISTTRIVQKYNSQFNPELAKQNII